MTLCRKRFVVFYPVLIGIVLLICGAIGVFVSVLGLLISTYFPNLFLDYARSFLGIVHVAVIILFYYVLLKPLLEAKRRLRAVRSSEGQD